MNEMKNMPIKQSPPHHNKKKMCMNNRLFLSERSECLPGRPIA
ncbi:hypothetical protein XBFFL1_280010 [Xenorhabdus bovienii str. feltiae Florida]|nr:hypothetical protein XBFFR1_660010 [Xenorhabdus bovienii str. feltiae France]CDG93929.1 hypothetical protein XBFFL1_280010 [Xenorhabdus bovienii str. feltiae Florida]